MNKIILVLLIVILSTTCGIAKATMAKPRTYTLQSPDGQVKTVVQLKSRLTYLVLHSADTIMAPSPISLKLSTGEVLGANPVLKNTKTSTVDRLINAPFYKRSQVKDNYNELVLNFKNNFSVVFRAYNDGVAYRFITNRKTDFKVENEEAAFNFSLDGKAIVPYVNQKEGASFEQQFFNSFENTYTHTTLSKLDPKRLAFLPLVVEVAGGKKVCITEADLESYPGMYLNNNNGSHSLKGVFAPYPKSTQQGGHNQLQQLVTAREPFIASCKGSRSFPWRAMIVAAEDRQLADNDMVYKLASPSRVADISWIKPGKVAWDWWNDWNITGVDFKSGVNNQTYKYYIDFAAKYKMEYVILDEGWAVNMQADLMQVVPEINIKELVDYGQQRNVGIILWAGYHAFNRDMEQVAKTYAGMGVKGFKVDFMDRDDQQMVDFYYRAAQMGAKYKLLMDFHGAYKPTGLNRTYPNVLNSEGVHGLEQMKWSPNTVDQVTYDVTIPFIRMLAGPMDYTQGAMRNATRESYHPVNSDPMSQGTRCRQLAEYVVFEAPINMLCDNPSNYMKEPETTAFIAAVPEVWDETRALDGEIGKHVSIARKKGNQWYIGALTNWERRETELDLSFLGTGTYKAEIFRDGVNADKNATDYKHETIDIPASKKLKINLAPGGGFTARIYPQ
jgi:alpha-glucosidase